MMSVRWAHAAEKNQDMTQKTSTTGFSKLRILADFTAEIHKHEFQVDSDRRSVQELSGIIESQRRDIDHTLARDEQLRRVRHFHEQLSEQNWDLREVHMKSLNEMEDLKRFQGSTFD